MAGRKYIEQGWTQYRRLMIPTGTGKAEYDRLRQAYFCGAAVLFDSIIRGLDAGTEPTENDYVRMNDLQAELHQFGQELDASVLGPLLHGKGVH